MPVLAVDLAAALDLGRVDRLTVERDGIFEVLASLTALLKAKREENASFSPYCARTAVFNHAFVRRCVYDRLNKPLSQLGDSAPNRHNRCVWSGHARCRACRR